MLILAVVAVVLFAAAAVIKMVVALCGHTITWRLSLVVATVLVVLVASLAR